MKILLVVASPKEIQGFDLSHDDVDLLIIGVGKLNAYEMVFNQLQKKKYDVIINAGTAGSKDLNIGEICFPSKIFEGDAALVFGNSHIEAGKIDDKNHSLLTSDNFISSATGTSIDDSVSTQKFTVFDMEGFAVLKASKFMSDKVYFIKIVSDNLNGTLNDWEESVKVLAPILVGKIEQFIQKNYIPNYNVLKL